MGIKRFLAEKAEMSLTAITSFESARGNFLSNRRTSCLESKNQTFIGLGGRNESNNHYLVRIGQVEIFQEHDVLHV